jgi:alkanesulfonate monooxygenase SsuD/methylene tetrahydromethanopterin reductase-like flavin-dependent oxidoreductase (luciferase family)
MSRSTTMNFGVYLNNRASVFLSDFPMGRLLDLAVEAEELGYHSVWLGDSMLAKPRYDPTVTFAAIAARTKTVKLATGIFQPHLRHPVQVALEWATLDIISGGRTILGVGIGAGRPELLAAECEVAGFPRRRRGRVFEESIEAIKRLWTEETVSFKGEHYSFADVTLGYKPVQKPHPPIWIAAGQYKPRNKEHYRHGYYDPKQAGTYSGPFERVARLADGWLTACATPDEYRDTYETIRRAAVEKHGRPADAIHPALDIWINVNSDKKAAREEGKWMLENYHRIAVDEETVERWLVHGTPEECVNRLKALERSGVGTLEMVLAAKDQAAQMRRIARDIFPAFGR